MRKITREQYQKFWLWDKAKKMRNNPTPQEETLWQHMKPLNYKYKDVFFRRQYNLPRTRYIIDFYCEKLKIAIELDGGHHNKTRYKNKDILRDKILEANDIIVLRFSNKQVDEELPKVLERIHTTFDGAFLLENTKPAIL